MITGASGNWLHLRIKSRLNMLSSQNKDIISIVIIIIIRFHKSINFIYRPPDCTDS